MQLALSFLGQYISFLGDLPLMTTSVLCFVLGLGVVRFILERVINV